MNCNFCTKPLHHVFIDLGLSPIANALLDSPDEPETFYPLKVYICDSCGLVQQQPVQTPQQLFGNYSYFSSYSKMLVEQAQLYAEKMKNRFEFETVVEIGSNDGYLLQFFKDKIVTGIEPARNVAKIANVPTIVDFFNSKLAQQLQPVDLIIANNVMAHIPDINDFVLGLKTLLKPNGIITVEFPHLLKLIENNEFDTIYHEHNFYFTLTVVEQIFAKHNLTIFDVEEIPNHGGSLRIYAKHFDSDYQSVGNVAKVKHQELDIDYGSFAKKVHFTKRNLLKFLINAKQEGKSIIGYAAPAKATTLLNYCGIRNDFLDYVVDDSPHKQGKYIPGVQLPIYSKIITKVDYILLLAWNLRDEIMNKVKGNFIIPIPEVYERSNN